MPYDSALREPSEKSTAHRILLNGGDEGSATVSAAPRGTIRVGHGAWRSTLSVIESQQEPLDSGPPVTPHDEQVGVDGVNPIEDLATDIGGFGDHQVEWHVAQWMTRKPLQLGEQPRTIPVAHADWWQIDHCHVGGHVQYREMRLVPTGQRHRLPEGALRECREVDWAEDPIYLNHV